MAVGAFAAVVLVLVVASVELSTARLSFGTLLWGPARLWRGHTTAFRAAALDPRSGRFLDGTQVELRLRDARCDRVRVEARGNGALDLPLAVPADLDARATVVVRMEVDGAVEELAVDVEARDTPGPMRGSLVPFAAVPAPGTKAASYEVALYPALGELVLGLENRVTARVTRDGRPARTAVKLERPQQQGETDALGLWQLTLVPRVLDETLVLAVGPQAATLRLVTRPRPAQLTIDLETRLVRPGTVLDLGVRTLPFRDAVRADLWVGEALVSSDAAPARGEPTRRLTVRLPPDARGLARLEVYRGDSDSEPLSLALWLSTAERAAAAGEALAALASIDRGSALLRDAQASSGEARARLVELALTRFVAADRGIPLLRATVETRATALAERVGRLRQYVHTVLALTVIAGALVGGTWAVRRRRRLRVELEAALAEDGSPAAAGDAAAMTRLRGRKLLDLVLVLATLGLFVYALLGLLRVISWGS